MKPIIYTADLHLDDNPVNEYRWSIFSMLSQHADHVDAAAIVIAGDLTHAKDNHSARLVSRIVASIVSLTSPTTRVYILKGNHDYVDPTTPFFGFLDKLPRVRFISDPETRRIGGRDVLFLPHTKTWHTDWASLALDADTTVLHQPLLGSIAQNGTSVQGVPPSLFDEFKSRLILAGDIHDPQVVGRVEYIGAPHPIAFGDDYKTRILIDDGKLREVKHTTIKKKVIVLPDGGDLEEALNKADVSAGDHVKVLVSLKRRDYGRWSEIRAEVARVCDDEALIVYGIEIRPVSLHKPAGRRVRLDEGASVEQVLDEYASHHKVKAREMSVGKKIMGIGGRVRL